MLILTFEFTVNLSELLFTLEIFDNDSFVLKYTNTALLEDNWKWLLKHKIEQK